MFLIFLQIILTIVSIFYLGLFCLGLFCLFSRDYLVLDCFFWEYFAIWDCFVWDCFVWTLWKEFRWGKSRHHAAKWPKIMVWMRKKILPNYNQVKADSTFADSEAEKQFTNQPFNLNVWVWIAGTLISICSTIIWLELAGYRFTSFKSASTYLKNGSMNYFRECDLDEFCWPNLAQIAFKLITRSKIHPTFYCIKLQKIFPYEVISSRFFF